MTKLKLQNVSCSRGAPMGRRDILPDDLSVPVKLRLVRLSWVDGDYDQGGAYWGNSGGTDIYWASNRADNSGGYVADGTAGCLVEVFVRASDRQEAKAEVRELLKNSRFYN